MKTWATPESWEKVTRIFKDLQFFNKPPIDFFNVGGTYQLVPVKAETRESKRRRYDDRT